MKSTTIRLLITTFTFLLLSGLSGANQNHNSSRSNKSQSVYPGSGSSGGSIPATTMKRILAEVDKTPQDQVNQQLIRALLQKYGVSNAVNKIIVEHGANGVNNIVLLQDPKEEAAARKVLAGGSNH